MTFSAKMEELIAQKNLLCNTYKLDVGILIKNSIYGYGNFQSPWQNV